MRIIHVIESMAPQLGGPPMVAMSLGACQARAGHEVHIICSRGFDSQPDVVSDFYGSIPGWRDVHVHDAKHSLKGHLIPIRELRVLQKLITSDSFIHIHMLWEPFLMLASWIARKYNISYCVTPHSVLHPWQMQRYRIRKSILFATGWRTMMRKASFLHALNDAEAEFLAQYQFNAPIRIVPNGVFTDRYTSKKATQSAHDIIPELGETTYVLFVSRLHYQKGITTLVRAFIKLTESDQTTHLVIAGPDYGEKHIVLDMVEKAGIRDRVHVLGPLYGNEKAAILKSARCFCLPSLNEGFSMAILEALAAGVPVVISKQCFFSEVETGKAGMIPDDTPEQIASCLLRLIQDDKCHAEMSKNARRLVETKYNWLNIATDVTNLYMQAARNGITA